MSEARENANRRLLRARDTMDRHFARPLDVDELARIAYMSRFDFIRRFRGTFGETPYRYLQRRRVERAMFLMRYTEVSVTEACMAVGFSSLGSFSTAFSTIVGFSPLAYRNASTDRKHAVPTSFIMRWTRPVDDPAERP